MRSHAPRGRADDLRRGNCCKPTQIELRNTDSWSESQSRSYRGAHSRTAIPALVGLAAYLISRVRRATLRMKGVSQSSKSSKLSTSSSRFDRGSTRTSPRAGSTRAEKYNQSASRIAFALNGNRRGARRCMPIIFGMSCRDIRWFLTVSSPASACRGLASGRGLRLEPLPTKYRAPP